MALIDFPASPSINQVYKHNIGLPTEKSYIFMAGQTGASDGYWSGMPTNTFGSANFEEINAGVVDDKFIPPSELILSKYLRRDVAATMEELLGGLSPVSGSHFATKGYTDTSFTTSTSGYADLPGGFRIAWGLDTSIDDDDEYFTFHDSFNTTCLFLTASFICQDGGVGSLSAGIIDKSNYKVNRANSLSGDLVFSYLALGY